MRVFAALAAVAVVAVRADADDVGNASHQPDHSLLESGSPDVEVVEVNKEYNVKLDCVGCPYARKVSDRKAEWEQPPRENALVLYFKVDTKYHDEPTLLLNGRAIQPLEELTPFIQALQIPANMSAEEMDELHNVASPYGVQMPLQYEHTVLRTQEHGQLTVQFEVTGLPLDEMSDPRFYPDFVGEPYKMDSEKQKLVQLRLHHSKDTGELLIEDVSVIPQAARDQPYRMKCGRLDMVKTTYDPREWDTYGKYWTWGRLYNMFTSETNFLWGTFAVCCMVLIKCLYQWWRCREGKTNEEDAEIALLSSNREDAPPAYADVPIIKIEEYD